MIKKDEILEQAYIFNLSPDMIEKDYVLSWVMVAISNRPNLSDAWVFKGGTCLKKCYFENYRFSEDLDYTLKNITHLDPIFLESEFKSLADWVYEHSQIELANISFEGYLNPQGNSSTTGRIGYRGPLDRKGDLPKIKLDLTADELLVFDPEKRAIYHKYSDIELELFKVSAYNIEEIFAEKIRAMVQRLRPRDLYDVINLHMDNRWSPDKRKVVEALEKKCAFKNVNMPSMELMGSLKQKDDLIVDWDQMLSHQISELEGYEFYWDKLPSLFEWLYS